MKTIKKIWHSLFIRINLYLYNQCKYTKTKGSYFKNAYNHQEKLLEIEINKAKVSR
ncbi:hypothetical protein [Alkalihalobacillus sp. LMS39]|uniref:hypothetical protein n=1 Tax=Alkalihalobacillus sp. LMS39 TaxID=2924032 RepID=UPI001FB388FE|nr:hypothetical protein [Alkalihalobacillus sp. LMS39]UOE93838.1 hypothetical protein MM271_22120 [Alkalihalobacillus sp. LMS39]